MRYASSVIIVPGYGLAAAQGQQKLYEFVKLLLAAKVQVNFAIHPVAGRMPGQMDVLLAEAGVPYDLIFQLDDINADFASTDVALVIGANDVVNPAARTDKSSPIFGMPILDADKAKQVYVIKRGQGKGYSGIVNALFYEPNCNMVFGDAQAVLVKMIEAVRGLGCRRRLIKDEAISPEPTRERVRSCPPRRCRPPLSRRSRSRWSSRNGTSPRPGRARSWSRPRLAASAIPICTPPTATGR